MNAVTDERIYLAKATWPPGNSWRTGWLTKQHAMAKARQFVSDWLEIGVKAKAGVFYRDGSLVEEME